ncbi:ferredoxin reductase family protein [Marispirochaeta aestuarii]|uniref:ferredoxin reductase family protein n=1 Tax=Marispirochaeta aestuarii TaxID=1963862 RepID=UPI0029C6E441|nr:ferredoxin reductase family protein [Marispirochaeta aestuarii]
MTGRIRGGGIVFLGLYFLLPLLFTALYFVGNLYSFTALFELYNLSIITGALAYILFMGQFLLSARLRFIERFFPQDKLLSFHGTMGMVLGGLILIHFIIKYISIISYSGPGLQSSLGFAALLIFILLMPAALLVLQGRAGKSIKSMPYARAKTGHNLFALAGLLTVVHVYLASSTGTMTLKLVTLGWGVLCLSAYVWHKLIRPRKAAELVLERVKELSPEVNSFRFRSTGPLPRRSPGQFGYFSFVSDKPGREEHPFTVASPPDDEVEIIVKKSGDFTSEMPNVPVSTRVLFDGPYGHFHPAGMRPGTPLYCIAGGIGITPFLSMIRDDNLREKHPIRLIWSVQKVRDLDAAREIIDLSGKGEVDLRIHYTNQGPEGEQHRFGRIDLESLAEMIPEEDRKNATVFICGPKGFGRSMRRTLKSLGVPGSAVKEEKFSW